MMGFVRKSRILNVSYVTNVLCYIRSGRLLFSSQNTRQMTHPYNIFRRSHSQVISDNDAIDMSSLTFSWPGRNRQGELCKHCLKMPKGIFCRFHKSGGENTTVIEQPTLNIDALITKISNFCINPTKISVDVILQTFQSLGALRLSNTQHDLKCSELTKTLSKLLGESTTDLNMEQLLIMHNYLSKFPHEVVLQEVYLQKLLASSDACGNCLGDMVMGIEHFRFSPNDITTFIYIINSKLRALNAAGTVIPSIQIAKCLYGFRRFNFTSQKEVRWVTGSLIPQVEGTSEELSPDFVYMTFQGLKYRSSADKLVHTLVGALAAKIQQLLPSQYMNVTMASSMLSGLGLMRAENPNIQHALQIISQALSTSKEQMTASLIAGSLHGMRCMTAGDKYVSDILLALCQQIENCPARYPFKAEEITLCMSGLRAMDSEAVEVRYVLSALAAKIKIGLADEFTAAMIAENMACLEGMSGDHKEVRDILTALTSRLGSCVGVMSGVQISRSLQGMRGMNFSNEEVSCALQEYIALMTPGVIARTDLLALAFTARNLVGAFHQGVVPAVKLVTQLMSRIDKEVRTDSFSDGVCTRQYHTANKEGIVLILWQTMCFLSMSEHIDDACLMHVKNIKNILQSKLPEKHNQTTSVSAPERVLGMRVEKYIAAGKNTGHIRVSRGEVFRGFETDIIIRVVTKDPNTGTEVVDFHNIEIDGSSHYLASKRIGQQFRDAYFRKCLGVKVHRVDVTQYKFHSKELNDAVMNYVKSVIGVSGNSTSRTSHGPLSNIVWTNSAENKWGKSATKEKSNS